MPEGTAQVNEEIAGGYGGRVSATTISKTTTHLAEELERYRTIPIADEEVEFLFLDGISERVRELGVELKILLCA
ncbi:MAG: hypothetical protein DMG31_13915 [Acidobacteria bacterium]|nr:MAG: hypothetical protein DMG31_13915 [Acidobacteriota bacterium]